MRADKHCKFPTLGQKKLAALPASNAEIARALQQGTGHPTQSAVSRWRSGDSRPDSTNVDLLEAAYSIPADSWTLASERRDRRERKKRIAAANGAEPQEKAS